MNINFFFYIFIFLSILFSVILFPKEKEMIYVFEKSNNIDQLKNTYKRALSKVDDKLLKEKYINILINENLQDSYPEVKEYIEKERSIEILDRYIASNIASKNYTHYISLLELGFKISGSPKYIEELKDYYSFTNDKGKFSQTLKRLYYLTNQSKYLDIIYNEGDTKFAISEYLKILENLDSKSFNILLSSLFSQKRYQEYLKVLDFAYSKTNDIFYLSEKQKFFSFINDNNGFIKTTKELYFASNDPIYLEQLYGAGEKGFALEYFQKSIDSLTLEMLKKLYKFYLWSGDYDKIYKLVKDKIGIENLDTDEINEYVNILSYFGKYDELIDFYKFRVEKLPNEENLINLAQIYDYYGYPDEAADTFFKTFLLTGEEDYIDNVISIYQTNNNYDKFLQYSLIKLDKFYSVDTLKQIISLLNNIGKFEESIKLVEKNIEKDPSLLELLVTLYISFGKSAKVIPCLMNYPPEKLPIELLNIVVTEDIFEDRYLPYIKRYYHLTKDIYSLGKLFRFYTSRGEFLKFNFLFKDLIGKVNNSNYDFYLSMLPDKNKKFAAVRIGKSSFDTKLLNNIGIFLMGLNEQVESMNIFKKVLFIDPQNLTALEQTGKLYYWQQNFEEALNSLFRYEKLKDNNPIIKFYIGEILYNRKNKDYKKYLQYTVKNIKRETLEEKMVYLKAYTILYGIDNVLKDYHKVLQETNFNKDIYADYIDALIFSGKNKILNDEYKKFLAMSDEYKEYLRLIRLFAYFNIHVKNFKEAETLLDKGGKIINSKKAENNTLFSDYGYLYYSKGDKVKAVQYYKKAFASDNKNKDLKNIVDELDVFFSRKINISYSYRNDVNALKIEGEYPFRDKIWLGIGHHNYNFNRNEIFFKLEDINKSLYSFEAGINHLNITLGSNYRLFYSDTFYEDYKKALSEEMKERKIGFRFEHNLKSINNLTLYGGGSKNYYTNQNGDISETTSFDIGFSYKLNYDYYFTTGFTSVNLDSFKDEYQNRNFYSIDPPNYKRRRGTEIYFDDYKALNFNISKYSSFDSKNLNFNWYIGTIYDLNSSDFNYTAGIHLDYKKRLAFDYQIYYDKFSKDETTLLHIKYMINF